MQIKDIQLSNMINKVQNTNILLKFQSGHTISIFAPIGNVLGNSCKRPIENGMPYGKADSDNLAKPKL
jgi:hypothetical protein